MTCRRGLYVVATRVAHYTRDRAMTADVSVLVLTKNEEMDLPGCLETVSWSDDVVVLDSLSTDRTVDVANTFGARVISRQFDNWASHQNWAIQNIQFKHPWVFYIDADERITPELKNGIKAALTGIPTCVAYRVRRRDFLRGTWLKHA